MKTIILLLIFIINLQLVAQEQVSVRHVRKKIDYEFSIDKLYNKKTGKRVSEKEFKEILKKNPDIQIEQIYNNKGKIVKYLYDPDNIVTSSLISSKESVTVGDYYPELIFKTIDGEIIKLKDLNGKMVILRFEMEADTFRFKKQEIKEMDQGINDTERRSEIEAIIIFEASKEQVRSGFDFENSNFRLVPNGFGFLRKLNINTFPTTVILDKQGRLLEELLWTSEGIDILELLNKS